MTRMRLRAEFTDDDEERQKWFHALEELNAIADSAICLVNEETAPDNFYRIDFDALRDQIITELKDLDYKISAVSLPHLQVKAGSIALKRALHNLIINAATHGGGAAVGMVECKQQAELTILDHGPGIPEHLLGQVLEPFFRVEMARRKTVPGAGLGLAIAKEIIERAGGGIRIANRESGGLLQCVTLPIVTA